MKASHCLAGPLCFRATARDSKSMSTQSLASGWTAGRPGGGGFQVTGWHPAPSLLGRVETGTLGAALTGALGLLCDLSCPWWTSIGWERSGKGGGDPVPWGPPGVKEPDAGWEGGSVRGAVAGEGTRRAQPRVPAGEAGPPPGPTAVPTVFSSL